MDVMHAYTSWYSGWQMGYQQGWSSAWTAAWTAARETGPVPPPPPRVEQNSKPVLLFDLFGTLLFCELGKTQLRPGIELLYELTVSGFPNSCSCGWHSS